VKVPKTCEFLGNKNKRKSKDITEDISSEEEKEEVVAPKVVKEKVVITKSVCMAQ